MKRTIFLILSVFLLCGCAREEEKPDTVDPSSMPTVSVQEVEEFPLIENESSGGKAGVQTQRWLPAEEGIFLLKPAQDEGSCYVLHFLDYGTTEAYPTCARVNCTHDSADCGSYIRCKRLLHYDGTWLYFISTENGSDILIRQKVDGSGRETVLKSMDAETSSQVGTIESPTFVDGTVYLELSGAAFDSVGGDISVSSELCAMDPETGELTRLPFDFATGNGWGNQILGYYGNHLVLQHEEEVEDAIFHKTYRATYYLLDLETLEILVLKQFALDPDSEDGLGSYQLDYENGVLIFHVNDSDDVSTPEIMGGGGKKAVMYRGQRLIFDLKTRQGYLTAETDLSSDDALFDGYLLHYEWNEGRTAVTAMLRDLATGEEFPMPDIFCGMRWYNPRCCGDYYIFNLYSGDEKVGTAFIHRDDFWKGEPNFLYLPDWSW